MTVFFFDYFQTLFLSILGIVLIAKLPFFLHIFSKKKLSTSLNFNFNFGKSNMVDRLGVHFCL